MDIKNHEYYLLKISEFLDGELNPEETRELFNFIADNPELQEELKSSMAVRNMFHQELIPPPKQSRIMLYSKLNLQKTAVVLSLLLSFFAYFRRFLLNPAVGATLLGIVIFLTGYFTSEYAKNKDNSINPATTNTQIISQQDNISNVPIVSSKELNMNSSNNLAQTTQPIIANKKITKISPVQNFDKVETKIEKQNTGNTENENIARQTTEDTDKIVFATLYDNNSKQLKIGSTKSNFTEIDYFISSFLDKMSISITKSNNSSNIKTDLEPLSNPLLNDYSIAIGYNINENNIISFELGQENFPQRYTGVINESNAIIYQVYTAQWYGVSYQYNFDKVSNKLLINPFFRVLSSLTKVGPFFKTSLGMNYYVNDKLILNLGLEGSTLIFEFQGNQFNTAKYGIFYGAKLNF